MMLEIEISQRILCVDPSGGDSPNAAGGGFYPEGSIEWELVRGSTGDFPSRVTIPQALA
jgi:hypothetical protein